MLEFFGMGGAFDSKINACAYRYNKQTNSLLIIDCGENTFIPIKSFLESKKVEKLVILITHQHSDHIGGLSTLLHYLHYVRTDIKWKVVVPNTRIRQVISHMLHGYGNDFSDIYSNITALNPPEYLFTDLVEQVQFIKTPHVPAFESFGILLKFAEATVYYSGDSYTIPKQIMRMLKKINKIQYYYQDISLYDMKKPHMSIDTFARKFPISATKGDIKVIFYHNSKAVNEPVKLHKIGLKDQYLIKKPKNPTTDIDVFIGGEVERFPMMTARVHPMSEMEYIKLSCKYLDDCNMEYLQIGQSMYKIVKDDSVWESQWYDMGCEEYECRCSYNITENGGVDCIANNHWMLYDKKENSYHDFLCTEIAFQDFFRYREVEFNSVPEGANIFELVVKGDEK